MRRSNRDYTPAAAFAILGFVITVVAAFIRHCWWSLGMLMSDQPLMAGKLILAVLGVVIPPLGVLHGIWLWLH